MVTENGSVYGDKGAEPNDKETVPNDKGTGPSAGAETLCQSRDIVPEHLQTQGPGDSGFSVSGLHPERQVCKIKDTGKDHNQSAGDSGTVYGESHHRRHHGTTGHRRDHKSRYLICIVRFLIECERIDYREH